MILSQNARNEIAVAKAKYPYAKSAILPALHIANSEHGFVNSEMYNEIADVLGVKYTEVSEAASFYTMFPRHPRGKYLIQVCHNISCALLGAEHLTKYLLEKFDIKLKGTSSDNLFTVIEVECLGSCTTAPMMQINDDYYENLTHEKVDQIIEDLTAKAKTEVTT